ncbi:MAG: glycosyltransferase family 9 protein, partial [Ktedonobacterales bacterium]
MSSAEDRASTPRQDATVAADRAVERAYDSRPSFDVRLAEALKRRLKRRVQQGLRAALGGAGRVAAGQSGGESRSTGPVQRILVVRLDLLGDVVLSLPAVRALKRAYPDARIDMLVLRSTADILRAEPEVARVHTFDPSAWRRPTGLLKPRTWHDARALLRELRGARYDLALSVSGDIASILARLSGARRRFGYADEAYRHFLTDTLPGGRYQAHQHEVRYVLALAAAAGGIVAPGDERLSLHVQPDATRFMAEQLRQWREQTELRGPVVAIHAGARNGQAKRWPTAHFATLADRLVRELDALIVLTGAPNEEPLARAIVRRTQRPVLNLTGRTTIPELVALLATSDLL